MRVIVLKIQALCISSPTPSGKGLKYFPYFFFLNTFLITVEYKISSDHDDCLGGPAEEVFGHLEILQLHRGPTSDEHTEHLIRNSQVRSVAKLRLDHTQHHDCVTSIPIHDEELNILNQSNFHPCKMISLALT